MNPHDDEQTQATWGDVDLSSTEETPSGDQRYEDLGHLARGGMGEVRRVRDRFLRRVVVRKTLLSSHLQTEEARQRFVREALTTAQLQHPGVVAVYDAGIFDDGRAWYTMREVTGRTLKEIFKEVWAGAEGWSLHRAVDLLIDACEAVAYAHERGIMHRDLKPANVMVGSFGDVQVIDWGLARREHEVPSSEEGWVDGPAGLTSNGTVLGTPAYMAPEQARGSTRVLGPTADVYALGSMLYTLLEGRAPYRGRAMVALERLRQGPPPELQSARSRSAPALVAICQRAMAREPDERQAHAGLLARDLRDWLHGARQRVVAQETLTEALEMRVEMERLREEAHAQLRRSEALLREVRPHDPEALKIPGWDAREQADAILRRLAEAEIRFTQRVRDALRIDATLDAAHQCLADHYQRGLLDVLDGGNDRERIRLETLVRRHDRGRHADWLRGTGTVSILTEPVAAEVHAWRYDEVRRRRTEVPLGVVGTTPLLALSLPEGRYVFELVAEGRARVRYPVRIRRGEAWSNTPPDETEPAPVHLPLQGSVQGCWIAGGWCVLGGDDEAPEGLPRRRVWIDDVVMQPEPVTVEEFQAYLVDLCAQGKVDQARAWVPAGSSVFVVHEDGRVEVQPTPQGNPVALDMPVTGVSWKAAEAYADWLTSRTGHPWRLPHELEWEKAARGVDGRAYPWGDYLDPTWARMQSTTGAAPWVTSVHDHPVDISPYGVRGLGGNAHDWCANGYLRHGVEHPRPCGLEDEGDPTLRMVKGGAWSSSARFCRSAARYVAPVDQVMWALGFRLCYSPSFSSGQT